MANETTNHAPSPALYKYVDMAGLCRILEGSLRFTQPSAFNDPFELLPEIVMPIGEPERPIHVSFDIFGKRRDPPVGEVEAIPEGYGSADATSRDIVGQLNALIGISCLSKNSDSLLMWSHYAAQYSGAVIEFDSSHELFGNPIEMEYRHLRPKKHLDVYLSGEPIPLSELCVKSDQWAYEGEVRIVRRLVDCQEVGKDPRGFPVFVQPLPLDAIRSIALGERMSIQEQREIVGRVMHSNIILTQAAIDLQGYGFRRELIKLGSPLTKVNPVLTPRTAHLFSELNSPLGEFARAILKVHPLTKVVNKPV